MDDAAIQTNIVRIDGQRSVYLPILKSSAEANTIAVVDGIKEAVSQLIDIPKSLVTSVVFDQSVFVKTAIENLIDEGVIGLVLTGLMILVFLGNVRATLAVFLSIPLSALAAFIALQMGGSSVNAMILGGLALVFSRLIDNSVIVLENIFRHMELGESPEVAAEKGGEEVALAVLAATLTTAIVFFPVTFLAGVSKFLFSALALVGRALALRLLFRRHVGRPALLRQADPLGRGRARGRGRERADPAPLRLGPLQPLVQRAVPRLPAALRPRPGSSTLGRPGGDGRRHPRRLRAQPRARPRAWAWPTSRAPIPGQFVINLKAAPGTRIELTEKEVDEGRGHRPPRSSPPRDLRLVVSNIGSTPDLSSIYTSNSAPNTAYVQVSLKDGHRVGSYDYMDRVRAALRRETPELTAYFQSGGLVDAVLNQGIPAPIDVQVSGNDLDARPTRVAEEIRAPGLAPAGGERRLHPPGHPRALPAARHRPVPRDARWA